MEIQSFEPYYYNQYDNNYSLPTLPFFENDDTPVKFCVACSEGGYCAVTAAIISGQPIAEHEIELVNEETGSGKSNESTSSLEMFAPYEIQQEVPSFHHAEYFEDIHNGINAHKKKAPARKKAKIIPALDEHATRKRYSRFRLKNHVCDICNKSFTLKQNVQTHISLYHMTDERIQRPPDFLHPSKKSF